MRPIKITPISKYLYRVEVQEEAGFWIRVHDCDGIPWSDVKKYLPSHATNPNESTPHLFGGLSQSGDCLIVSTGYAERIALCDWCHQNPRQYMAVSDTGRHFVCNVCASDVDMVDHCEH